MLWLVTGCSTGLGLSIAHSILDAGHQVIASSRNPAKTPEAIAAVEKKGGKWITLDVTSPEVEDIINKAITEHGPIDVLVNNAGYAIAGPFESEPLANARAMYEANVFGCIRTMQAVLPSMRQRTSGTIVNISSAEAWAPNPLIALYSSTKWALEGLTEAVAMECAAHNIRALLVEPDAIRTEFANMNASHFDVRDFETRMEPYKGTFIEEVSQLLTNMHGTQQIDPDRAAKAIVAEVTTPGANPPTLRLPIGKESTKKMRAKVEQYTAIADATEKVAASADFE